MISPEDTKQFAKELEDACCAVESRLGQGRFIRPFVCNGPLTACDVFIVGVNPRENMAFRPFWDGYTFFKARWEAEYRRQRLASKGSDSLSPTRRKLDLFCEGALPYHVLETNLYPIATDSERLLAGDPARQDDAIFSLLLKRMRPRAVVTHGRTARNRVFELLELDATEGQGTLLNLEEQPPDPAQFLKVSPRPWGGSQVMYLKALRHLGRNYSYDFMRQLGEQVRKVLSVEISANSDRAQTLE